MKAGQMMSFVALDPLVDAPYRGIYQQAFARLQDDAPPMPPQLAIDTITAELGRSPRELFAEFDPHPIAAASIGQVHGAMMHDGRWVAVKVQYPGVEQAIRADLKNTELLATFFQLMLTVVPGLARVDARGMAAEVADRIGEEIDYRKEAANQQRFVDLYRGHPFIRVPEIAYELSGHRVLTMELSDGMRYARALEAEQPIRNMWGEAVYRFVWGTWLTGQLLNVDPHPGNFLFHPDGSITCLDFGCVKQFGVSGFRRLDALTRAALDGDAERMVACAIEGGFAERANPPEPGPLLDFYRLGLRELTGPQPFTFTPELISQTLRDLGSIRSPGWQAVRKLRPDPDYILLSRHMTALSSVLGGLRATGPWRAIWAEFADGAPPATRCGELDSAYRQALR